MITEDYVSFEVAKLLKEKGFDIPCNTYFAEVEKETAKNKFKRKFCHSSVAANRNAYKSEMTNHYYFSCPTLQMAMKWLRKVHEIFIRPNISFLYPVRYYCEIFCYGDNLKTQQDITTENFESPEEACKEAIRYCLENLI